jgi:polysaccharide export outer membrane protein
MKKQNKFIAILILIFLCACSSSPKPTPTKESKDSFAQEKFETTIPFATPEMIKVHESNLETAYQIGPGDFVKVAFWGRPELSAEHVIGPFGRITLPMLGEYEIGGQTRDNAAKTISNLYTKYYENPIITVTIMKYLNNKVYVLGRVTNPGIIHFEGNGTLLEALSLAGGLPTRDKTIFLSKCSIIRGDNQIIWVDLVSLLQKGNIKLNVRLRNNDVIYIPEATDAAVFVMGEVKQPGAYQIQTSGLSFLDAINLAGGPTENANIDEIRIIRNMKENNAQVISLNSFLEDGKFSENILLKDDDIIFIPQKGIAKFNYYLRQIDPLLRTFVSGALLKSSFFTSVGE